MTSKKTETAVQPYIDSSLGRAWLRLYHTMLQLVLANRTGYFVCSLLQVKCVSRYAHNIAFFLQQPTKQFFCIFLMQTSTGISQIILLLQR